MLQRLQITCGFVLEAYTRRTTHNGILKNCTVGNIAIKAFLRMLQSWSTFNSQEGCTMMPLGSECCKGSKLLVGFVYGVVHKAYHSQWNFKKLYCS